MRALLASCLVLVVSASLTEASGLLGVGPQAWLKPGAAGGARDVIQSNRIADTASPNPTVLPPGSQPYGASYGEWGGRWWRWVLSIPEGANPLVNDASAFCDAAQSGPVWFLVGQSGTHSCTVPAGRGIFFPIINAYINAPCPFPECAAELTPQACAANPAECEACLQSLADDFLGSVTELVVEVDGQPLHDLYQYRASSGLFTFAADPSLSFIDACLTPAPQPFLADGYWIMLAPLPVGQHQLHFAGVGVFLGSPFSVDVTYNLTIAPRRGGRGSVAADASKSWGLFKELYR